MGNTELPISGVIAQTVNTEAEQHNQALRLTEKGYEQLNQGQAAEALKTWQENTKIYLKLHKQEGVTGSLVNQSLALQSLGLYPRACNILSQALKLDAWICDRSLDQSTESTTNLLAVAIEKQAPLPVNTAGLQSLGDVLRLIGKPDESEIVLEQALAMAKRLATYPNTNDILLSLANTERILYNQARYRYQSTEELIAKEMAIKLARDKFITALNLYQKVTDSSGEKQNGTVLQALLNRLSLSNVSSRSGLE